METGESALINQANDCSSSKRDTSGFQYTHLGGHDSIRLLVLKPATNLNEALHASFRVVKLEDDPQYDAISYTWGLSEFPEQLHFQDRHIPITTNLASALKRFRCQDTERVMWADAVCINQNDLAEKGRQVSLMSDIYKKAHRVLIWLGDSNEMSKRAMEGYRFVAGVMGFSTEISNPLVERALGFQALLDGLSTIASNYLGPAPLDMLLSHDMNYIYERPWFTRLWIVQEVCLASSPIICCGTDELHWIYFAASMMLFKAVVPMTGFTRNPIALLRAYSIVKARAMYHILSLIDMTTVLSSSPQFGDVVESLRGQDCTEDRDRIYALLSLRYIESNIEIVPDYSLPVTQVYMDYASRSLSAGQLEILYDAGLWYREEFTGTLHFDQQYLPSWVPDFRKPSHRTRLPWLNHRSKFQHSLHGEFSVFGGYGLMALNGFLLNPILDAKIAALPLMFLFGGGPTTYDHTRTLIKECLEMCRNHHSHELFPTDADLETAFWNTVIMEGLGDQSAKMLA